MAPSSAIPRRLRLSLVVVLMVAVVAFSGRSARCQTEKRLSSVQQQQQQQQQYYIDPAVGDADETVKSQIRSDAYSQQPLAEDRGDGPAASTVYGEHYGDDALRMQHDQPALLDEEAQESISSSASINNHRIPQYTRGNGGSPVQPADVVEGKTVGNRAVGNQYHGVAGNPSGSAATAAATGYAVDSAYNPHFSTQDLIQDQNYQLEFKYHDYDKMTKFLRTTSSRFPNLTALYSIGKSVQGTFMRGIHGSCRT